MDYCNCYTHLRNFYIQHEHSVVCKMKYSAQHITYYFANIIIDKFVRFMEMLIGTLNLEEKLIEWNVAWNQENNHM